MWNLSETEILLTVSELSVAFAGFASLASILGQRFSKDDPRLDAGRLLNMLTVSLALTVLSLVPLLPMLLGWSPRLAWGASGAMGLATMASLCPSILRRVGKMKQYQGFNAPTNLAGFALALFAVVGFASSAFGFPSSNPFSAYFGSIIALLTMCAALFFRVIVSLLQGEEKHAA